MPSPSPGPVTRDGAQAAARHELAKPPYHRDDPSWFQRVLSWLARHLVSVVGRASQHAPGHGLGVGLILVLAALAVVAVVVRVGPLRRPASKYDPVFGGTEQSAADYRRHADNYAAAGEWALAVRERLRTIARELEERGVLDPRPGRTAAELGREAGRRLPDLGPDLRVAIGRFDAIWYGGATATAGDDESLRALDSLVTGSKRATLVGPA
jgi:hypothetical protein